MVEFAGLRSDGPLQVPATSRKRPRGVASGPPRRRLARPMGGSSRPSPGQSRDKVSGQSLDSACPTNKKTPPKRGFPEAADGIRTHDLLHGKRGGASLSAHEVPADRRFSASQRLLGDPAIGGDSCCNAGVWAPKGHPAGGRRYSPGVAGLCTGDCLPSSVCHEGPCSHGREGVRPRC